MKFKFCYLARLFILFFILCGNTQAENISLTLRNVNLPEAIRILTQFMGLNVILSSTVSGAISLELHNASAHDVFQILLQSQGLAQRKLGNVIYIAPRNELYSIEQERLKFQEAENENANLITKFWQIHYAKAEDISHLLQDSSSTLLSKRGHVKFDARTNKLCVQDVPSQFSNINSLILKLDVPVQQVLIEARLASVDNDFEKKLGLSFSTITAISNTNSAQNDLTARGHFSLAVAKLADGSYLDVALAAMESEGKGELISSPSLFTANQQSASIESGEEIPYQEVSRSGGTGVAFKKAVLSLKVTPQILPEGKVLLQLQVNQDRPSNRIVLGVPAISTRQITTSVLVKNGQTLVLGGIYELDKEKGIQRVPFLGKIPLLGILFQQHNLTASKRELLIFVTPKIIS